MVKHLSSYAYAKTFSAACEATAKVPLLRGGGLTCLRYHLENVFQISAIARIYDGHRQSLIKAMGYELSAGDG